VVTVRACANIALVKYWGKRDSALNLPAAGSLSLTLGALVTETSVEFDRSLDDDELVLDGAATDNARVTGFLDLVRERAKLQARARVHTENHFPTASGLASSASGFAALALAASRAAGLDLPPAELSALARRGSGSAARSIFGGFVRMRAEGDSHAEPVSSPLIDKVRMVVAIVGGGAPKTHGSRDAMEHTTATSPFYRAWIDLVPNDLAAAEAAVAKGDLEALGEIAEGSAFAMHACALAARPAIVYWQPPTVSLLARVRELRKGGTAAWATIDAGPHVKVLTTAEDAGEVRRELFDVDGVTDVIVSEPGGPAQVVA
jgi:diphosphomevalonate decarboxylase